MKFEFLKTPMSEGEYRSPIAKVVKLDTCSSFLANGASEGSDVGGNVPDSELGDPDAD